MARPGVRSRMLSRTMRMAAVAAMLVLSAKDIEAQGVAAEALFREAKALMASSRYAEACEAFRGSYEKEPLPTTLVNLADCREKNGELASAWAYFLESARLAARSNQDELAEVARSRAAAIEPRLSRVTLAVPSDAAADGLTITRDNVAVDAVEWGKRLPIDGGRHRYVATAPGRKSWDTTVTVAVEGDDIEIVVPPLALAEVEQFGPAQPGTESPPSTRGGRPALLWGTWAVGVLALGSAAGLEIYARSAYSEAKAATTNPERQASYELANDRRLYAGIVAGVGVVAVGAGVYLWFTRPSRGRSSPTSASLQLDLRRNGGLLGVRAGF
jgi:tetratricopeptide (TPR) repeat protein